MQLIIVLKVFSSILKNISKQFVDIDYINKKKNFQCSGND